MFYKNLPARRLTRQKAHNGNLPLPTSSIYNATMLPGVERCSRWTLLAGILIIAVSASAQSVADPSNPPLPANPTAIAQSTPSLPDAPVEQSMPPHRFWDRTNILLFCGIGAFRGLDYASTRNFQRRGRTEILLPDDVVNNSAGFAAVEAAGTAASVGISYIFHRTGHHKMERWLSIGHIAVTGFGAVRNYSLKSKRPSPPP
jgi:hypothetical protein